MPAVRALLAAPRAQHLEAALAEELQGLSVLGATRPLRFFPRSLLQGGRQLCHGAQREVGPQRAGLYGGAALRAGGGARRGAQQDLGAGGAEAVAAGGEHGPREELEAQRAGGLGRQRSLRCVGERRRGLPRRRRIARLRRGRTAAEQNERPPPPAGAPAASEDGAAGHWKLRAPATDKNPIWITSFNSFFWTRNVKTSGGCDSCGNVKVVS